MIYRKIADEFQIYNEFSCSEKVSNGPNLKFSENVVVKKKILISILSKDTLYVYMYDTPSLVFTVVVDSNNQMHYAAFHLEYNI